MTSREGGAHDGRGLGELLVFHRRLATETDLRAVLRDLLQRAKDLTGAERGFFFFRSGGSLACEAATGEASRDGTPIRPPLSEGVLSSVLETGEPVLSTDLPADERFRARVSVRRLGIRSVLAVPFPARSGATGVLYLDSRVDRALFRRDDLGLLTAFAAQAALALDNARLLAGRAPPTPRAGRGGAEERDSPALASIIGSSPAMLRVFEMVRRVGRTGLPVLIVGESGTGKELVARAIHAESARRALPFIAENCAAIPETLIESELFGSVRGAFTGSDRDREGLFRAADGGTLFLDELGEMPLPLQARLLRVLQQGEVRPLGSPRTFRVDVRVVAATNRDPLAAITSRRLRLDLYYRLAGMTIELPPLRDRREDIEELTRAILSRLAATRRGPVPSLSPAALALLASHDWPGNVRELENEIERAAVLARNDRIEPEDLTLRVRGNPSHVSARGQPAEKTMIEAALLASEGSVTDAATAIGWSRQKLYRRMRWLGVPRSFGKRG